MGVDADCEEDGGLRGVEDEQEEWSTILAQLPFSITRPVSMRLQVRDGRWRVHIEYASRWRSTPPLPPPTRSKSVPATRRYSPHITPVGKRRPGGEPVTRADTSFRVNVSEPEELRGNGLRTSNSRFTSENWSEVRWIRQWQLEG